MPKTCFVRPARLAEGSAAHAPDEHAHPSAGIYAKVGLVLFVLTALEVGLYEIIVHLDGFADARRAVTLTVGGARSG